MNLINKIEIRLENFDKCHLICDQDCSLGQLFDYACSLKAFISQKIKDSEVTSEVKVEESKE